MDPMLLIETITLLIALAITLILVIWILRVVKETLSAILLVGLILGVAFIGFQILPKEVLEAFTQLPDLVQTFWQRSR